MRAQENMNIRMACYPGFFPGWQIIYQNKRSFLMGTFSKFNQLPRAFSTKTTTDDDFSSPHTKGIIRHDPNLILDEDTSLHYSTRDETLRYLMGMCRKMVVYSITTLFMIMMVGTEDFEEKCDYLKRWLTFEKYAPQNLVKYQHDKILRIYDYRESKRLTHIEKMKNRFERRERMRLWKRKWKYNLGLLRKRPDDLNADRANQSMGYSSN